MNGIQSPYFVLSSSSCSLSNNDNARGYMEHVMLAKRYIEHRTQIHGMGDSCSSTSRHDGEWWWRKMASDMWFLAD